MNLTCARGFAVKLHTQIIALGLAGASLVAMVGVTTTEMLSAIKRVTDIMGEISATCNELATQQSAALVEAMAVFKLAG
jgi:hypothetical protein